MPRLCHAALLTLLLSPLAQASSFLGTTDAIGNSLAQSSEALTDASSSLRDDKRVLAARDDAASFVGSNGQVRGVQLEAAFEWLRRELPAAREASDIALAQAILAR